MILTVFYLWKDIWRQWLTNPLSCCARIAIAGFLFGLALGLERYFVSVEGTLASELDAMGLNRIVLSQNLYGDKIGVLRGSLDGLIETFAPASGRHVYLRRMSQVAEVELLGRRPIYSYRDSQMSALQAIFPDIAQAGAYVCAADLQPGTRLSARIGEQQINLQVIRTGPSGLAALSATHYILIPDEWIAGLDEFGFTEIVIYQSAHNSPAALQTELAALGTLLRIEGFDEVNVRSGYTLLERLEHLRARHARWSLLAELFAGLLMVIVFASTGLLEYRQNAYLSALLQSMGVGRGLLSLRYLVENLILLTVSFLGACLVLAFVVAHYLPLEFENGLSLDALTRSFQAWSPLLLITAAASCVPIGFGLRRQIGSILQ